MWRIAPFVPAAASLLVLASLIIARKEPLSRKGAAYLALFLWFMAWLSIVLWMQSQSPGPEMYRFIAQRDIGYYLGSALFLLAPFAVVTTLSMHVRRFNMPLLRAAASALALATAGSIFVPALFATGWVVGCVFTGYPSCM
jgi:hypothetical protein